MIISILIIQWTQFYFNSLNLKTRQACEMSIVVEQERLIEWVLEKLELRL
jgi:hypothetical protein